MSRCPSTLKPLAVAASLALLALANAGFFINLFNLVPITPFDGGNLLAGLLPQGPARLVDTVRPYGFLLIYLRDFAPDKAAEVAARVGGLRVVVTRPWLRHATFMADSREKYKYGILDPMRVDRMRARTR